ncbi:hypothetical protein [Xanthomonas arboricola]|uniref:LpxL/LpxP family acyltransferase n=1 Tax=Xanthomonas arboricola TaxID=56448 RepID=UPI00137B226A|nr:hypothetical protein [Xanthomonas arboricola]
MITLFKPLLTITERNQWLEKKIKIELDDNDLQAIKNALLFSGENKIGPYYHWYFQKLVVNDKVKSLKKDSVLHLVKDFDKSDYSQLEIATNSHEGILLATPHHGHYILSIIAAVERLSKKKSVLVFYGDPNTHRGNDIFDDLCQILWKDNPRIAFIHDNRRGLATALKALGEGSIVVIMPDVFKNEKDTLLIPFCGRQLNVPLGTAVMARKTGSTILPMISKPLARGTAGFETIFGNSFKASPQSDQSNLLSDYAATVEMFLEFEKVMRLSIFHWQYVREHFRKQAEFPQLSMLHLEQAVGTFLDDPRVKLGNTQIIELD